MIRYVTDHSRGHANISEIEQDDAQPAGTWRSHIVTISGTGPLSVKQEQPQANVECQRAQWPGRGQ